MRRLLTILLLSLTTVTFAQEKSDSQKLLGCWTDSREESTNEFSVYRPCDYKSFPASRFRFKMVLKEDGKCKWLYLAPNDGHHMKPGSWKILEESRVLTVYAENGRETELSRAFELAEDELRIKTTNANTN